LIHWHGLPDALSILVRQHAYFFTMSRIANRFAPFGTTIFAEMTALANKHGAVNLSQGFPDFEGPDFIKHAAQSAMRDRPNQYGRMQGVAELNGAIAARWKHLTGHEIDGETQITVTSGCTEALAATFLGLANPGDEVILFEPYYDCYAAGAAMSGATIRAVTLRTPAVGREDDGFTFDPDELRRAFTPRTRAIVVNTPHNPTGKVFTRAELALIAKCCVEHDVVAITDEVYEGLVYEPDALPHIRLATLPGMRDRTITLSSLGKTYSMTGWKIGWAIASAELTRAVRSAHQFLVFCAPVPLQHGAAEALRVGGPGDAYMDELAGTLRARRDELAAMLRGAGFRIFPSPGTYFIVADHTPVSAKLKAGNSSVGAAASGMDDAEFCRWLTCEVGVAAIPCSVFYSEKSWGRALIRFTYGKRAETLMAARERLSSLRARA
jgi:aspartate/methionine/tyrosine aminotransferase